ncbi:MAG: T9SS type A sorting domain-containing protein [Candidatus Neomarinimicrobiota bacterium]
MDLIYQISKNKKVKKDIDEEMFKTYLKTFDISKGNKILKANAMLLLARLEKDVKRMDKIYKEHKSDYMGIHALNDQFMYYFHEEEDTVLAKAIIDEMDAVYPDEYLTYEAHLIIGDDVEDPFEYYSRREAAEQVEFVSAEYSESLPEEYSLKAAFPNPFNPSTTLEYALPVQSDVECAIFDLSGNVVKEFSFNQSTGLHSIIWNAEDASSGIYLVRFVAKATDGTNSFVDYQKVTLLK